MNTTSPAHNSTYHLKRVLRLFAKVVIFLLLLIILIFILIQTPPVQDFVRKKTESYLEGKLKTRVDIGKLYIGFPNKLSLRDVYVEDRQKDTLISGGRLAVDISLFKLLSNEIEINEIQLEQITANIKRQLPDTTFNFQFIVDAFTPPKKNPAAIDTAAVQMAIKSIILDKVRVVYQDVITGNDMEIWVDDLTTTIDRFDPAKLTFSVPDIQVNGIKARIYQSKPLVDDDPLSKDLAEAAEPIVLNLKFGEINLQNIDLDYRNDVSGYYQTLKLGELDIEADAIDLPNRVIRLDKLHLNKTTSAIRLANKPAAKKVGEELAQEITSAAQTDWRVVVKSLQLNDNNIRFDNDGMKRTGSGMDYSHLKADGLTLHADNFLYSIDSISATVTRGSFREQSGFTLRRLETNFLFAAREAHLHDLVLETPNTRIGKDISIRYPSLKALGENPASLQLYVDLDNSRIQVKDILAFAPQLRSLPAFSNANDIWTIDGRVDGSMSNMNIRNLQFSGLSNTRIDVTGNLSNVTDVNRLRGNLNIRNLSTTRTDLAVFIPKNAMPDNITLPERISLQGTVNGGMQDMTTDLRMQSDLGNASIKGRLSRLTNPKTAGYNVRVSARGLQLGKIMQDTKTFGPVSADVSINGSGFDPETARGKANGVVHSAFFNDYNYTNIKFDGSLEGKRFVANAGINDPNIHLTVNASGLLTDQMPSLKLTADIDSLKTQPLKLTPNVVIYRGQVSADFASIDPDNLVGQALITHSILSVDQQRMQLDTVAIDAGRSDSGRFIRLTSDVARVAINGEYRLTQLGAVIQNAIQPHFALVPSYEVQPVSPYDFTVNATILDRPFWRSFMPDLKRMERMVVRGNFSSVAGWSLTATSPTLVYGPNHFSGLNVRAGSDAAGIDIDATLDHLKGNGLNVYGVAVDGKVANNQVDVALNVKDRGGKDKYHLDALLRQPQFGTYVFSLQPQRLLLNYQPWDIPSGNTITLTDDGFNVRDFVLTRNNQELRINSTSTEPNAPVRVGFTSFKLGTLTGFVQADTSFADGTMNGTVLINDITKQLTFTSDLTISDLSIRKDTLGNATIRVSNTVRDNYQADVRLTGRGNDLQLTGNYFVKPGNNSSYDLVLDVRQLQLNTIEGATMGAIKDADGTVSGRLNFNGTVADPNINGRLAFNKASMNITMLNNKFLIDQEELVVNNEGISFNTFTIKDETGNAIVIDGMAATTNFFNYRFNLGVTANSFQVTNTTKKESKLFYGKLVISTNMRIRGTEEFPVIDGGLSVDKQTDFTVVVPQQEPGIVDRQGVIEFVDMDAPRVNDSLFIEPYQALDTSTLKGFDVNANIEINKEATLSLVIDAGNGDFVRMKGEGLLNGAIDPSGKITLSGSYEIQEGSYEITFNFLRRKFLIQKGSKIVWQGEPTDAALSVTAVYVANTSPIDLVEDQLAAATSTIRNTYRQRLPFEVHLKLTGELMRPNIAFDIILPEKNYSVSNDIIQNVEVKLEQIRQEPSELNKQVFALLLLNRFVGENPFATSGGGFSAKTFARQSASKLLTEQLNRLAENLIQGVDINFDVTSTEDYTTGERRNKTDFNVSLSKNLLSERLRVTVGNSFELEGPQHAGGAPPGIAGDIAVDYKLSRDGRYMLRGYRKNEFEGVVEGYVIETGLSFILTMDYDRFAELFRRKKKKEKQPAGPPAPTGSQPQGLER